MDVSDRCRGVREGLIGCGEVGRDRQVSGNGGMGGSGQVIGGTGVSDRASEWTIRHDVQMQRGAERSGQMQRGKTFSFGSHWNTSSFYCVETMGN